MKCGIMHAHGGQTCNLQKGHDGACESKPCRGSSDGSINWSTWRSVGGKFAYHIAYKTIYPANAVGLGDCD